MTAERLQTVLARAGLASRRAADRWIAEGRVTVNGTVALPGTRVDPGRDAVSVDGRPVTLGAGDIGTPAPSTSRGASCPPPTRRAAATRSWTSCSRHRPAGCWPAGRLDVESEGLMLLTNDGAWAQRVLHPRYAVPRSYAVQLDRMPSATIWRASVPVSSSSDGPARLLSARAGRRPPEVDAWDGPPGPWLDDSGGGGSEARGPAHLHGGRVPGSAAGAHGHGTGHAVRPRSFGVATVEPRGSRWPGRCSHADAPRTSRRGRHAGDRDRRDLGIRKEHDRPCTGGSDRRPVRGHRAPVSDRGPGHHRVGYGPGRRRPRRAAGERGRDHGRGRASSTGWAGRHESAAFAADRARRTRREPPSCRSPSDARGPARGGARSRHGDGGQGHRHRRAARRRPQGVPHRLGRDPGPPPRRPDGPTRSGRDLSPRNRGS